MKFKAPIGYSFNNEICSMSSRLFWCAVTAQTLHVLDDDCVQLWMMGELSDRDLLDNITSHGDLANLRASKVPAVRQTAAMLTSEVNNLLTGLVLNEAGNFELCG